MRTARPVWGRAARAQPNGFPANHRLPWAHREVSEESAEPRARGALARDPLLAQLEAALFAADEPLPARRLAAVAGIVDGTEARRLVRKLQALYEQEGGAFQVEELAGGFQLLTRAEFHPWLARLRRAATELRLTPAARETLAIVAYRQPITRSQIEFVRGVNSDRALASLVQHGLATEVGRAATVGRPTLFGTTPEFLQQFGLSSLDALPRPEMSDADAAAAFRMAAAQRIREAVGVDEPDAAQRAEQADGADDVTDVPSTSE